MDKIITCAISNKELPAHLLSDTNYIGEKIKAVLKTQYPEWNGNGFVSNDIINKARTAYITGLITTERGDLDKLDKEVVESISNAELMSRDVYLEKADPINFGEKLADKVASFGGSWKFIILFGLVILIWILLNVFLLIERPFDPYPFILLNLVLSCLAALQAPVIMMSQNRQEAKDRIRSKNDYKINLKAELEIRLLNEKIDHMLIHQHQRLFEIQQIQIEMMEEIAKKLEGKG